MLLRQPRTSSPAEFWLAAFGVLALSLAVRLFQIDLAPFDLDQVHLIGPAAELARTGHIPLVAGSTFSVGINIPPLISGLLAQPMLITHSPVGVAAYCAALDALAAAFVYATVRQLSTPFAAASAGALYAVLPAAAVNARWMTNGALVPLLSAMALWALVGFVRTGSAARLAVAFLMLAWAAQLHLTSTLFLVLPLLAALVRWRDVRWGPLGLAAGLATLTLAPYAYFQLLHGWADVQAMSGFLAARKVTSPAALAVISSIVGGDIHARFSSAPLDVLGWLLVAVLVMGAATLVAKRQLAALVPVLWLALPMAGAVRHSENLAVHYFLAAFPAIAALLGIGFGALPLPPLRLGLVGLVVALRFVQWVGFQNELAAGDVPPNYWVARPFEPGYDPWVRYTPPYNVPLRYSLRAARLIDSGGEPVYVGPREGYEEVLGYLSSGRVPVLGLRSDHGTLLPHDGALITQDALAGGLPWELERFASPVASVAGDCGKPVYRFMRMTDGWRASFLGAVQPMNADFGGGPRLSSLVVPALKAGQSSALELEWQLPPAPASELSRMHVFAHVVDFSGKSWSASEDPPLFAGVAWQPGDSFLAEVNVSVAADAPTGGYSLELGLYDLETGRRLPVAGGDQVRVGPLKVYGPPAQPAPAPKAIFGAGEIGLTAVQASGDEVTLTWSALAKPAADYTVFVHALDADGRIVAQHDSLPAGGSYPTSLWDAGDVIQDRHPLSLPGAARLEIGLYTKPDLQRLPANTGGDAFEQALS